MESFPCIIWPTASSVGLTSRQFAKRMPAPAKEFGLTHGLLMREAKVLDATLWVLLNSASPKRFFHPSP